MLFFQLHALLFLISSTPVFATPIPVPPEGPSQALVPPYRGIKFTIPEELHRITLYRVPGSDSDVGKQLMDRICVYLTHVT